MIKKSENFIHNLIPTFSLLPTQPTLASIEIIKTCSHQKLPPKSLMIRTFIMLLFTLLIIVFRLWIQDFTTPEFRPEDNPIAAIDDRIFRLINQNYLYVLNIYLLLMPDWLSFDWSFGSIELIKEFQDERIYAIAGFYAILGTIFIVGFKMR